MAKTTLFDRSIIVALILSAQFGHLSVALGKSQSKKNKITQQALNLNFSTQSSSDKEKTDLDLFTEESYLDSEFAAAKVKLRRKKISIESQPETVDSAPQEFRNFPKNTVSKNQKSNTLASLSIEKQKKSLDLELTSNENIPNQPIESKIKIQPVAPSSTVAVKTVDPKSSSKNLGLSLGIMKSNSLYNFEDGTALSTLDYSFSASYKVSREFNASVLLEATSDLNNEENSGLTSGRMGINYKSIELDRFFSVTPSISVRLPVNSAQRIRESLVAATALSGRFKVAPEVLFSDDMSLGATLSFSRGFHEYSTSTLGNSNTEYSSVQSIDTEYQISRSIGIAASFSHINKMSYEGTLGEAFEISQELSYQVAENISATIGHVNGGSVFKSDGETSNIYPYDENNSIVYGGLNVVY